MYNFVWKPGKAKKMLIAVIPKCYAQIDRQTDVTCRPTYYDDYHLFLLMFYTW